jgi:hypothetical protein
MSPKVKNVKKTCRAEAENFANAIQIVLRSPKLQQLIDAFEEEDKPKFAQILDSIPGLDNTIKQKMKANAHTNTTVSFTWF